ncbi:uncharacterized protein LOC144436957 [Glandiceps talaboti]
MYLKRGFNNYFNQNHSSQCMERFQSCKLDLELSFVSFLAMTRWRDDLRCGDNFPVDNETNTPGECDPYSGWPCCSAYDWCGLSKSHCDCPGCVDYRKVVRWRNDMRCGDGFSSLSIHIAECDPYSSSPCCSTNGWCGNSAIHCDCKDCVDYRTGIQWKTVDVRQNVVLAEQKY